MARIDRDTNQAKALNGAFLQYARIYKEAFLNERCKVMEEEGRRGKKRKN